jgi:hypothetical protein
MRFTRIETNFTNYTNFFLELLRAFKVTRNVKSQIRVIRKIRFNSCKT